MHSLRIGFSGGAACYACYDCYTTLKKGGINQFIYLIFLGALPNWRNVRNKRNGGHKRRTEPALFCGFERTRTCPLANPHIRRAPSAVAPRRGLNPVGNRPRRSPCCGTVLRHTWRLHWACAPGSPAAHHSAHQFKSDNLKWRP